MNAADRPTWRDSQFSQACWDMGTFLRPCRVATRPDGTGNIRVHA